MVHPACPLNVECKKTMHIMENNRFKVIIVEDVKLELKGTEEIFRHEIPNAEVIGTAMTENEFYWTWAWGDRLPSVWKSVLLYGRTIRI